MEEFKAGYGPVGRKAATLTASQAGTGLLMAVPAMATAPAWGTIVGGIIVGGSCSYAAGATYDWVYGEEVIAEEQIQNQFTNMVGRDIADTMTSTASTLRNRIG